MGFQFSWFCSFGEACGRLVPSYTYHAARTGVRSRGRLVALFYDSWADEGLPPLPPTARFVFHADRTCQTCLYRTTDSFDLQTVRHPVQGTRRSGAGGVFCVRQGTRRLRGTNYNIDLTRDRSLLGFSDLRFCEVVGLLGARHRRAFKGSREGGGRPVIINTCMCINLALCTSLAESFFFFLFLPRHLEHMLQPTRMHGFWLLGHFQCVTFSVSLSCVTARARQPDAKHGHAKSVSEGTVVASQPTRQHVPV